MSLFSTGLSGLNAAQIALSVTGNNLTNVDTPGYNRQIAKLTENLMSSGVQVTTIERQFDSFVAAQLNKSTSLSSSLSSYSDKISQLDALLGNDDANVSTMMNSFFSSLKDLASEPADTAARQGVIGSADNMTAQFRSLDSYIKSLYDGVNSEISSDVNQINNLASDIANLNKQISLARAKSSDEPNALLDQRDYLVSQLSQFVNVSVVDQGGSYNVTIGNGLSLVAGTNSFKLEAMQSAEDPTRTTIGYRDGNGNLTQVREKFITGGSLGGVLQFRNEALTSAQNRLGQLAITLAMSFNDQHAKGVDLSGNAGTQFFSVADPVTYTNAKNTGTASLDSKFTDASQVALYDYNISYNSTSGYTVTRQDTGEVLNTFPVGTTTLSFGGMELTVNGTPADGDKFLVRPLEQAAATMENLVTDVGQIAAGSPTGGTGTGDNRNALALQALQTAKTVGGVSTFNQAYASMVTDIGNRSAVAQTNLKVQNALTDQLSALQQSDSGVNMDEEAANLIKFQQYYQASAKVIDAAKNTFDSILAIVN
ncbi:flagellar hook-associated protein 1 FlgK [Pseudomonas nitritireducens]|uniref:Flagellar hook-associated protein 1 n=1 Tax=Pseudomonas nitroreducens TaxID=46680 RepID=A0A7W7P298_PSENT|nr:flagellar hook-associated protein FlgK [Pseudomonas nitritireducens]MBB4865371.1 flagellar hook-associated protein 1 FlgK [Pseudomonas nitritireducens]